MKFELVGFFHPELIINTQSIVQRGLKYSLYQTRQGKVFIPPEVSTYSCPSGT